MDAAAVPATAVVAIFVAVVAIFAVVVVVATAYDV